MDITADSAAPPDFSACLAVDPYYLTVVPLLVLPEALVRQLPAEARHAYQAATEAMQAADRETALTLLETLPDQLPAALAGHPLLRFLAACVATQRRQPAAAASLLQALTTEAPAFGPAWAVLALLHGLNRDWPLAEQASQRALAAGCELGPNLIGLIRMFAALLQGKTAADPFLLPPPDGYRPEQLERLFGRLPPLDPATLRLPEPATDAAPVVLVCCDPVYLREHALPLAWSLERLGAPCPLHIHVLNPDAESTTRLGRLQAELSRVALTHSWEAADLDRFGPPAVFYSCARLCRCHQFVQLNRRAVLMVDADMLFRRPPAAIPGWRGVAIDAGVLRNPAAPPWENILAASLYVAPSAQGLHFLGHAAGMVAQNLIARRGRWFLDQVALYLAWQASQSHMQFAEWPPSQMADLDHQPDSILWAISQGRIDASAFTRFRDELRHHYDRT